MSTNLSSEITAIATAVLAVFAIITAFLAYRAFRKQAQEVTDQAAMLQVQSEQLAQQRRINAEQMRVLKLQAAELHESTDERQREADERRRAQASRVFIWQEYREGNPELYDDPPDYIAHLAPPPQGESLPLIVAHVENTSDQPIYDLLVTWTFNTTSHGQAKRGKPLMPHEEQIALMEVPSGGDPSLLGAAASFRDAAGVRWRSRPDGQLDEIAPGRPDSSKEHPREGN